MKTEPNDPINPTEVHYRAPKTGEDTPQITSDANQSVVSLHNYGVTKREYFAAKAMAGYRANPNYTDAQPEQIASLAVQDADALINQLNK